MSLRVYFAVQLVCLLRCLIIHQAWRGQLLVVFSIAIMCIIIISSSSIVIMCCITVYYHHYEYYQYYYRHHYDYMYICIDHNLITTRMAWTRWGTRCTTSARLVYSMRNLLGLLETRLAQNALNYLMIAWVTLTNEKTWAI